MRAWFSIIVACALLAACGTNEGDDLDKFIKESGKDMRGKVDPLPEVTPFVPVEFNRDGALNDPFRPRKAQTAKSGGLQPDLNRPREALEAFPLESLKYVGSLQKGKLRYALVRAPDNAINQVTIGNYLGMNLGMVTDITDNEIKIKEIVQDELSGDWVERSASINLQE
ncbi:pilus assembly protein, PilP [mine drainage metagenome]|uniref:Pilus assembly protein, PilP n=1 Tax=mine drainage metagenome TaxID=410659 RepID=A0A1J5QK84_9ZZZZ